MLINNKKKNRKKTTLRTHLLVNMWRLTKQLGENQLALARKTPWWRRLGKAKDENNP